MRPRVGAVCQQGARGRQLEKRNRRGWRERFGPDRVKERRKKWRKKKKKGEEEDDGESSKDSNVSPSLYQSEGERDTFRCSTCPPTSPSANHKQGYTHTYTCAHTHSQSHHGNCIPLSVLKSTTANTQITQEQKLQNYKYFCRLLLKLC